MQLCRDVKAVDSNSASYKIYFGKYFHTPKLQKLALNSENNRSVDIEYSVYDAFPE